MHYFNNLPLGASHVFDLGSYCIGSDTAGGRMTPSGAQRGRPELAAALAYLRAGDSLVVWKLHRLACSMQQPTETVAHLDASGIGFHSLTESIDTTTASDKLTFYILGALADFERSVIRERTGAGMKAARDRGRKEGRPCPFRSRPSCRQGHAPRSRNHRGRGRTADEYLARNALSPPSRRTRPDDLARTLSTLREGQCPLAKM